VENGLGLATEARLLFVLSWHQLAENLWDSGYGLVVSQQVAV